MVGHEGLVRASEIIHAVATSHANRYVHFGGRAAAAAKHVVESVGSLDVEAPELLYSAELAGHLSSAVRLDTLTWIHQYPAMIKSSPPRMDVVLATKSTAPPHVLRVYSIIEIGSLGHGDKFPQISAHASECLHASPTACVLGAVLIYSASRRVWNSIKLYGFFMDPRQPTGRTDGECKIAHVCLFDSASAGPVATALSTEAALQCVFAALIQNADHSGYRDTKFAPCGAFDRSRPITVSRDGSSNFVYKALPRAERSERSGAKVATRTVEYNQRYLHAEVVALLDSVVVFCYSCIPGCHRATHVGQFCSLVVALKALGEASVCHGDVRGVNILFHGDNAAFIDYDLAAPTGSFYASNYRHDIPDGARHHEATPDNRMSALHDWFSLAAVMRMYTCADAGWARACSLVESCKADAALKLLTTLAKLKLDIKSEFLQYECFAGSPPKMYVLKFPCNAFCLFFQFFKIQCLSCLISRPVVSGPGLPSFDEADEDDSAVANGVRDMALRSDTMRCVVVEMCS